jgi:hypothetical protein
MILSVQSDSEHQAEKDESRMDEDKPTKSTKETEVAMQDVENSRLANETKAEPENAVHASDEPMKVDQTPSTEEPGDKGKDTEDGRGEEVPEATEGKAEQDNQKENSPKRAKKKSSEDQEEGRINLGGDSEEEGDGNNSQDGNSTSEDEESKSDKSDEGSESGKDDDDDEEGKKQTSDQDDEEGGGSSSESHDEDENFVSLPKVWHGRKHLKLFPLQDLYGDVVGRDDEGGDDATAGHKASTADDSAARKTSGRAAPRPATATHAGSADLLRVTVSRMQWWTSDADLEEVFGPYGKIRKIVFQEDKNSGKSKGIAIIHFAEA